MRGAILAIGDELCIGTVVNNNAAFLAQRCTELGITIDIHLTIGDDEALITAELQRLAPHHDLLLLTGGLGPTHDDRTRAAIAKFFNAPLRKHPDAERWIRQHLEAQGRAYSEVQEVQSYVPEGCEPLPNPYGTAPGLWCEYQGYPLLIALPGVPYEMEAIFEQSVRPRLQQRLRTAPHLIIRTYGVLKIPEAELYTQLAEAVKQWEAQKIKVAFLPSPRLVRLRFQWTAPNAETATAQLTAMETFLQEKFGKRLIPMDHPLEHTTGIRLAERQETLAIAESCTGGYLGKRITNVPGSSRYFLGGIIVYSNEAKKQFLHVPQSVLERVGAVSKEVAELLAANVRTAFNSTYGIGITGIAGPGGGTPTKPVGTVWIGIATPTGVTAHHFHFRGNREAVRRASTTHALLLLLEQLTQPPSQNIP